jgi:hypothetical protein
MLRQLLLRTTGAALLAALFACSEPEPAPRDARFAAVVTSDGSAVPDWYRVRFKLLYDDGRVYEGECKWPETYTARILTGVKEAEAQGFPKPGRSVTSVREIEGSPASLFIPHGRGVMRFRDGKVQDGKWADGRFTGKL